MSDKHILPIVIRICHSIDKLFLTYVGPVGSLLCEESFNQWKATHRPSPLEIPYYIDMLAVQLPDNEKKAQFSKEAMHLIANHIGT
ncbi:MAG: hypothetical protein KZQ95_22165 [Candidatus Thiodiazotropha sp. (ex Epidulcina cf. delphinae)]|nr:hypothetical protein [Candidatus Thiodiazotropha sp. (ex Epidulcina cf. delphinae)]